MKFALEFIVNDYSDLQCNIRQIKPRRSLPGLHVPISDELILADPGCSFADQYKPALVRSGHFVKNETLLDPVISENHTNTRFIG